MAQVSYDQGVPTDEPQTSAPNDYQEIQPKAAQGAEEFGAGATKAADFFGQVAADNAFNQFQAGVTKLLNGDPSKNVMGADGQPMPDTGYLGLKGRAALDARPAVEKQMDDLLAHIRGGLQTPAQELQFDTYSRRYRSYASEQIGRQVDQQSNAWYTEVNATGEKNAIDHVANNAFDPVEVAHGAADLINSRVKQNGAQPGDQVYQDAVNGGKRDALKAQVQAISATDPSMALRILKKNQAIAGVDYEPLYNALRDKADRQDGLDLSASVLGRQQAVTSAAAATSITNPAQPVYRQAVTDIPGGMSTTALARTVQLESGGDAGIVNASGHKGLGQFSAATWAAFGGGGDPTSSTDSINAIQRYAAANSKYLTPILGRPPTDAELYLAHQQGPEGAAKLLANPNVSAATLIGEKAVTQNGGTAGMTAGQFTTMWAHKFNGTVPISATPSPQNIPANAPAPFVSPQAAAGEPAPVSAAPAAPQANPLPGESLSDKASAYQAIEASNLSPQAKQYAYENVNRQLAAQQIADDANTAQRKQQSDLAAGGYMTQILSAGPTPDLLAKIAQDPKLTWETKESLTNAARGHAEESASGATAAYGPGFWKAYQQVSAPAGDPSRVSDVAAILGRAALGGDLTLAGAQKLVTVMGQNTRSTDDAQTNVALKGLIDGEKSKMSFQQIGDVQGPKDPKGEQIFETRFVPKVMGAYDQWIKAGKDPWQFLTQDNFDKLANGLRSPKEMALAKLQATGDTSQSQLPPAPQGVDEDGWKLALNVPTLLKNGSPRSIQNWAAALTALQTSPTPDVIKQFDEHYAASGVTAKDMLDVMGVAPQASVSPDDRWTAAKPEEAPAAAPVEQPQEIDPGFGLTARPLF